MTTPPVPVVDSIAGLRELWPEWRFRLEGSIGWIAIAIPKPVEFRGRGMTPAEAAQALAEKLTAAGYPAKP